MTNRGLTKLVEECCELGVVVAKKIAYPGKEHPLWNYKAGINAAIEDEMGDVMAAMWFVQEKLGLSEHDIHARATAKYNLFKDWDTLKDL